MITNLTHEGLPPVDGDVIRITHPNGTIEEKYWNSITMPDETPITYLRFTLPEEGVVGVPFTIQVKVVFEDESLVPVTTAYYVPIVRESDSMTVSYHKVSFVDGQATIVVTPNYCGKLTMRLDLIEPRPTSRLPVCPFIHILQE